ncbi:MAG: peroxiredoxin, partial [Halomonadaceae bacterium]
MPVEIGQPVADFSATATGDTTLTLSELRGKQVV